MNITIRNIPDEIVSKIRTLSKVERRSLNSQMLIMLESGVSAQFERQSFSDKSFVPKAVQIEIWQDLAGRWDDSRTSQEIIDDIYENRTPGREVEL